MKVQQRSIQKINQDTKENRDDLLAVEEPLEIRLRYYHHNEIKEISLAVTMRTPGNDLELVTGFLFAEGIIPKYSAIEKIYHCQSIKSPEESGNVVVVLLKKFISLNEAKLQRNFYATSSCGVCGKSSIEAIQVIMPSLEDVTAAPVHRDLIQKLPDLLRENQLIFGYTGGLHAAALFDHNGSLSYLREDIGRHNALDKIIGAALFETKFAFDHQILVLSGRMGFELIQKAAMAGIQIIAAIGAPSSLAVQLAESRNMTLIGFVRREGFNIYCGRQRIID